MTEAGLYIPANVLAETDGGKVTTRPSNQKYYTIGTVLKIGNLAYEKLIDAKTPIEIGDTVYVAKQVLNNDSFYFYTDRTKQIQDFKGVICIPHTLIEAKL